MSKEFEKYAKGKFDQYKAPIDEEALWEDLLPQLEEDNKKNRGILPFFLWGFAAIILLSVGVVLYQTTIKENIIDNKDITRSTTKTNPKESETIKYNQVSITKTKDKKEASNISTVKTNQKNTATTISANRDLNGLGSSTSFEIDSKILKIAQRSEGINISKLKQGQDQDPLPRDLNQVNEDKETKQDEIVANATTDISPMIPILWKEISTDYVEDLEMEIIPNNPPQSKKKMRIALGIHAGIGQSFNSLTAKDSTGELVNVRFETEQELETVEFGIDALIQSKQNIYLRTGINYMRLASRLDYDSIGIVTQPISGITEIEINRNTGDTTFITGTIAGRSTIEHRKRHYNYTHLLDIPIILGYQFAKKSWKFGVEGGIYANLLVKNTGEILHYDGSYYNLKQDTENWYTNNIGVTPYLGLTAGYELSNKIELTLSAGYRSKKLFSTDGAFFKEERANLGLQAGIRYFLN